QSCKLARRPARISAEVFHIRLPIFHSIYCSMNEPETRPRCLLAIATICPMIRATFLEAVLSNLSYRSASVVVNVVFLSTVISGCAAKEIAKTQNSPPAAVDFTRPLPEGEVALRKIAPEQYPDFSKSLAAANVNDLRESAKNSLIWFAKAGSAKKYPYLDVDHDRAVASIHALIALIDSNAFGLSPEQFNRRVAQEFEGYKSVGAPSHDGHGNTKKVLFTGYFTPTYEANPTRGGAYQWPLYKRPRDLVSDATTDTAGRRAADGSLSPYYSRREIESGTLAGDELVWLTSRWNAYVITVQD